MCVWNTKNVTGASHGFFMKARLKNDDEGRSSKVFVKTPWKERGADMNSSVGITYAFDIRTRMPSSHRIFSFIRVSIVQMISLR
jgi:hypothetical protein